MKTNVSPSRAPVVLIVDDFEDNRHMYAEFLAYAGYDVLEAMDGAEAIAKARSMAPDLVVMDLSLPVVDGCEATRQLKNDPTTRHIPVVALTGHTPEGRTHGAIQAGCDGFLAKPCLPEKLLETIQRVLAEASPSVRKASPRITKRARGA